MPKITNPRYLQFKDPHKDFDEFTLEEFSEKLKKIPEEYMTEKWWKKRRL